MPANEKEDLRRVVFFQGSFFYTGRPIPGLEPENLPFQFRGSDTSANSGNTLTCVSVQHFGAPTELASTVAQSAAADELTVDTFRCRDCNRSFGLEQHMIQHCRQARHHPVTTPIRLDGPAVLPEFMAYLNVSLQRAMGERMRRVS